MGLPRESSLKARFPRAGQTPRASAETQATVARQRGCQRGERDLLKNTSRGANRRTFGLSNRSSTRTRPSACRPTSESAEGRDDIFKLWIEGGFGSEGIGRLHCVVTLADLPPAVAAYVRRRRFHLVCPDAGCSSNRGRLDHGDRDLHAAQFPILWASDYRRAAGDQQMSLIYSNKRNVPQFCDEWDWSTSGCLYSLRE